MPGAGAKAARGKKEPEPPKWASSATLVCGVGANGVVATGYAAAGCVR